MNSTAVNMTTCQGQFKRSGRRRAVLQGRTNTKWKLFWIYPFHLSKSSKWKKYLSLFPRLLFVWLFHYCLFTLIRLPSWHIVSNCAMCIYGTYKYFLLQNHLNDLYSNDTDAFLKLYCHSRKLINQEICSIAYVRFKIFFCRWRLLGWDKGRAIYSSTESEFISELTKSIFTVYVYWYFFDLWGYIRMLGLVSGLRSKYWLC